MQHSGNDIFQPPGLVGKWLPGGAAEHRLGTVRAVDGSLALAGGGAATIHGAPAGEFDGLGDCCTGPCVRPGATWSLECWVETLGQYDWDALLLANVVGASDGLELWEGGMGEGQSGAFALAVVVGDGDGGRLRWQLPAGTLPAGRSHLRLTVAGRRLSGLWIDGQPVELPQPQAGAGFEVSTGTFCIGDAIGAQAPWVGKVHVACLYAGAEPLGDLRADPQPPDVSAYLAFWRFKDAAGSAVTNDGQAPDAAGQSGSDLDLAVLGAIWSVGANQGDGRGGGSSQFSAGAWRTDGVDDMAVLADHASLSCVEPQGATWLIWADVDPPAQQEAGSALPTLLAKWAPLSGQAGHNEWQIRMPKSGPPVGTIGILLWDASNGQYISRRTTADFSGALRCVAFTYDGSKSSSGLRVYVDGQLADSVVSDSGAYDGMENKSGVVSAGGFYWTGAAPYNGCKMRLYNVQIYNRQLTEAEVRGLHTQGPHR